MKNPIENCVVCEKYLQNNGEQERGMCITCDIETDRIAMELTPEAFLESKGLNLDRCIIYDTVINGYKPQIHIQKWLKEFAQAKVKQYKDSIEDQTENTAKASWRSS